MNPAERILVVEDDAAIRRGIVDALRFAGYQPVEASQGEEGLALALGGSCRLLLLDLVLPGIGGLEILQRVRAAQPTTGVIVLTARGEEPDRVQGLRLGADDYVVKPFSVSELLARVEAVLRRAPARPSQLEPVRFEHGVIDFERREIRLLDGREELSEREVELLRYLVVHRGRAIAREEILSSVWHLEPRGISTRTIDMHIARLREKLRDRGTEPRIVLTVRGKGYMFQMTSQEEAGSSGQ
jgi:DNA-binding response OmpR family regulator